MLQAWFHQMHATFTTRRAAWLTKLVHTELLGGLPQELQAAADLSKCDAFVAVQACVSELEGIGLSSVESSIIR
jgi:hypothetical protein